ncbi:MAG: hypothetical protein FWH27_13845 [Planctomycetaceae bacterium]|nr:hypothetical protein [Planctomycetaceae bacterium]
MKKETLRAVLLIFLCSGFWVMTLALAASLLGIGFAQGPQQPYHPPGTVPPYDVTPQIGMQPMAAQQLETPLLNNNAMLPNNVQTTFDTTSQEVKIPFQVDTSRWLAFSVVVDNSVQTLTVLDPMNQSLAVYQVFLNGPDAGKCELKSVRNISGDLKFDQYEALKPLPPEMRAIVEQAATEQKKQ